MVGETQTANTPSSMASSHRAVTSAGPASGASSVWSTIAASSARVARGGAGLMSRAP